MSSCFHPLRNNRLTIYAEKQEMSALIKLVNTILRTVVNYDFSLALNIDSRIAQARNRTLLLLAFAPCSRGPWFTQNFPIANRSKYIRESCGGLWPWLFVLTLILIIPSCALEAQQRNQDIMQLLDGYEWELKPEPFICRGGNTDGILRAIASDDTLSNHYRLRALTALSFFQNSETADFLEHMVIAGSHPSQARAALAAFSKGFYEQQPERVIGLARRLLKSSDEPQLQYAAAKTLALIPQAEAQTAFDNYLKADISPLQRQKLERYRQEAKMRESIRRESDAPSYRCPPDQGTLPK